jgi:hypothetical protein
MTKIEKLERAALKALMLRTREWLKQYPDGLTPRDEPGAIRSTITRNFVKAALALYEAKQPRR